MEGWATFQDFSGESKEIDFLLKLHFMNDNVDNNIIQNWDKYTPQIKYTSSLSSYLFYK